MPVLPPLVMCAMTPTPTTTTQTARTIPATAPPDNSDDDDDSRVLLDCTGVGETLGECVGGVVGVVGVAVG